ncbi:MAG: RNA polymerase sigma factor [Gemmatimonadaceae bacterium]
MTVPSQQSSVPALMSSPHDAIPSASDEVALVARARDGDMGSFEQLYRATAGRVFALCLRMSGSRQQAQELTHDVFVRVWEKLASFRGDASFSTWLHRVTVNVVLEQARTDSRRSARVALAGDAQLSHEVGAQDDADFERAAARGADPNAVGRSDDVETRIDLERAIALLPPNARRVFVMHDVQGYRHEDIANEMHIAEGTVRAHLHRARQLLMERLRP